MKAIFNTWWHRHYAGVKSEWAGRVHTAFRDYYKREISMKGQFPAVTIKQVKGWMKKLGVIIIDRKGAEV